MDIVLQYGRMNIECHCLTINIKSYDNKHLHLKPSGILSQ